MIDRKPNNPYQYTMAVGTSEMFFGRLYILRQIYSAINSKQSISLVGSRRIGKSSILNCMRLPEIQKRFEFDFSRHIFISLNIAEYRYRNRYDFFQLVNKQIFDEARKVMGDLELGSKGDQENFAVLLSDIKSHRFHLVLLMDSFDHIARNEEFDVDFFNFLRSQCNKVSYVTASTAQLSKICHQKIEDSPFFNIFSQCMVGAFTPNEACQMIVEPAARVGFPFTDEETKWLMANAGYHPFFLHCACRILFDEKSAQNIMAINLQLQEQKIYEGLYSYFEDAWNHLEPRQQEILKQEMQQKEPSSFSMPEFSSSKLFQKYVRARYHLLIFELNVEELEKALDRLNEPRELGKSNLRLLTRVSQLLSADTSVTQKGIVIRDVLREAHERMRGSGARSDLSFDWCRYNILYYRYFKHHLQNEQISARLQFNSTRQYFRERGRALEALLNELLEMEDELNK